MRILNMDITNDMPTFEQWLSLDVISSHQQRLLFETLSLLEDKMRRYTGGDTSLSKEKTQMLMNSIIYEFNFYFQQFTYQDVLLLLQTESINTIYHQAHQFLLNELHQLYIRVIHLQQHSYHLPVQVYEDTLFLGLTSFFKVYNFDYDTLHIVLTLDYPTCHPLTTQGFERIKEYVTYLEIEHQFLQRFSYDILDEVLSNYGYDIQDLIENVAYLIVMQFLLKYSVSDEQDTLLLSQDEIKKLEEKYRDIHQDILYNDFKELLLLYHIDCYFICILDDIVSQVYTNIRHHCLQRIIAIKK